jgi:oxygen-independent coproporphyrinogen-3 oxidase
LYDIQTAHDAGATHISWYQLTIEPNTVFYRSQPILPDEDSLAGIEEAGQALLQRLGYDNYEVSAWAGASDKPCRHNINYWQFGDYLAIGAGAHGKVTLNSNDLISKDLQNDELLSKTGIYRFSKSRLPKDYMTYQTAPKMVNWQSIADDELVSEFMLNALRLHDGVTWSLFESRTGLSYERVAPQVNKLIKQGLLIDDPNLLQPTLLGRRYLNQILRAFL